VKTGARWFLVAALVWAATSVFPQPAHETGATLGRNLTRDWRDELDRAELERSWGCVDASGKFTCGNYSGSDTALIYATLIGSADHVRALSTREILLKQGDPALSAAAALGDLGSIRILIKAGVDLGLVDESKLGGYPVFRGGNAKGAHPAFSAAEAGQVDALAFFVDRGLDPNTRLRNDGVSDLFVYALLNRRYAVLQYLLSKGYTIDCAFRAANNGRSYVEVAEHLDFPEGASLIREKCR